MPFLSDVVAECIVVSRSSIRLRYLMNGLKNFYKTDREYSLAADYIMEVRGQDHTWVHVCWGIEVHV